MTFFPIPSFFGWLVTGSKADFLTRNLDLWVECPPSFFGLRRKIRIDLKKFNEQKVLSLKNLQNTTQSVDIKIFSKIYLKAG